MSQAQELLQKKMKNDKGKGFKCDKWTREQCETFLFVDMWDTLDDLEKRAKGKEDDKEFYKLIEFGYFSLNTIYNGVLTQSLEIAKKERDKTFLAQIIEIKARARKRGLF